MILPQILCLGLLLTWHLVGPHDQGNRKEPWQTMLIFFFSWSWPLLHQGAGCPWYCGITGKVFHWNPCFKVPRVRFLNGLTEARGVLLTSWVDVTHVNSFPLQACRDFLTLAQTHSKKWQKSLQYERDQRIRLEETLEQLAKQHNHLERAFRGATVLPANTPDSVGSSKGKTLVDELQIL